jgi:hypothetical protein
MMDRTGRMMYLDNEHLNVTGSLYAAPFILNALRK